MSEGDVSTIRDEDVLRRMWQQTEDFSRKKEIRAHMYRLREERLRNLYSPEPAAHPKGVESAMHVSSLLDQSFQGLKSKEVRDAGSPPKEYAADLKELSNAGWNVESEDRTTDDGHTQIRAVRADIEGRYDVAGGKGEFAAKDVQQRARTQYRDDAGSTTRDEATAHSAARDHVVQQTPDGALRTSTTSSSSTSTSKVEHVTSSQRVPYVTEPAEITQRGVDDSDVRRVTTTSDYEQSLRKNDVESGELMSRKVEYPDDDTRVIVETRRLADGTRVTSTRKEFRAPAQSTRSERHSSKSETRSYSSSAQHHDESRDSAMTTRRVDIVDSQRQHDDEDFRRNRTQHISREDNRSETEHRHHQTAENRQLETRQSSSKITRETVDSRNTTDLKKRVDDSTANVKVDHTTSKDDSIKQQNRRFETNIKDTDQRDVIVKDVNRNQQTEYSTTQRTYHTDNKVDETDRREFITTHDKNIHRDVNETQYIKNNEEKNHNITRDQKVEEVIEKKSSDQYQTTYQSDFTQKKKISNDWSPTHQAWASTLRADTPTTTRPSTRASSPGSKTYQSSTSSLRSSVSPDKSRKPPSRGGSPSKTDRSSPSRYSTDHYSSTHSTSSVTETRNYQHVSPDRKPPVSPTRYGSSPDRKPDTHHQRPSQSPEKRPQDYRPSSSPERKPGYTRPADDYPKTKSPTRTHSSTTKPSLSPERRPYQPSESPSPVNNRTRPFTRDAPRSSASPGRKPGYQQPSPTRTSPDNPADRYVKESSPTQPSTSPDRKPGYMRPTAASVSPDRKSSTKQVPSQTERKTYGKSTIKEDHYKFIDEETKMYTRSDREDIKCTKKSSPGPRDKSPSPVSQIDEPDHCRAESPSLRPTLRKGSRSPSPPKGPVTFTDDQINKTDKIKTTTTNITTKYDEDITKTYRPTKPNSPTRDTPREPSPSKYGTYDKKRRTEETEEVTTIATQKDSKDLKYDSLKRQEVITKKTDIPTSPTKKTPRDSVSPVKPETPREPSPSKYGTYDKKRHTEEIITTTKDTKDVQYDTVVRTKSQSPNKIPDSPISPTKKSLRDSVSPVKSPTKDTKYKHTTDFITTERKSEEVNKKTTTKNRQLVTPSSSPTRKPMPKDTAPSTGQSSPTTSVSEFVYFSSPNTERTIVTDLDDEEYIYVTDKTEENTTILTQKRPETLPIQRSPSPSKIPCRSPSPEKRSPTKDSLPRKSSLKKPSSDKQISPVEKPPSNFRVSPADETKYFPEHKVVKKDRPDKPSDSTFKTKHPFERRETYEERCLKILGVVGDNTKTTEITKESPVESPCRSPKSKESSPFRTYSEVQDTTKTKVTDFITREQEDNIKKATNVSKTTTFDKKSKSPSRDSSPTKLQDIISQKPVNQDDKTTTVDVQENITAKIKHQSPDRDIGYQKPRASVSPEKKIPQGTKHDSSVRPSQSPDRKPGYQTSTESSSSDYLSNISSTKIYSTDSTLTRSSESPERKPDDSPTKTKPKTPSDKHPKGTSPTRSSVSPDRKPGYMSSTMGKYGITTTIDVQEDITSTTTRQSLDRETGYAKPKGRCPSPTKEGKPFKPESVKKRPSASPDRKPDRQPSPTKSSPESPDNQRSSVSPDRKPSYMRPTSSSVTKVESTHTREEVTEDKKTTESLRKQSYPQTPDQPSTRSPSKEPEKSKPNRTPSPSKKVTSTTTTEDSTLLIQTEREQEILDRVQQSLRKLSPAREQRSPSREKSPGKTTISLQNIDVVTSQTVKEEDVKISQKNTVVTDVTRSTKPANDSQKPTSKPPSRTVSPTKKPMPSKIPESANKSRSISPKKPVSPTERPPSPQVPKTNGMKPRDPTPTGYTRKPTSGSTSPTKIEKITTEVKKSGVTKQNSFTKTITKASSIPNKIEPDPKRTPAPKGINKENVSPKKEDVKVTRTASDASLKGKKPSPQRVKSKPEIQVNDLSPTRTTKTTVTKKTTTTIKEPKSTLAPKPKSATALNTTQDDDDTIITDVEQAKSSRENSPDRICPTPVSFLEDVGTPRYPDEVKEPDDEFRSRTHHIIHETESLVDDIVEISEDEELFVKNTEVNRVTGSDECLLSVTDKVSKFTNKIETVTKPKDSTSLFKDVERQVHSDFITEDLKSDECLLSVSEKVNKFAKGPQGKRDRSPARKIVDEYDTETVYQDDYTKLSVNDKAHLFVETAENTKASKTKPAQKVERPDLSNVDDSLKSDECLLSVSDKVNKFVKTAEQFLIESHEVDEKEKKVREQYDKFIKNIVKDEEDTHETQTETHVKSIETEVKNNTSEHKTPSFAKETASSHTKVKDFASPNLKPTEKTATVKITTLRSSEAVKKAKALFENIASTTQQSKDTKTTKLLDIGVIKKSPKTDSTIVLHPSVEDFPNEPESDVDAPREPTPKDRPSSATLNRQQRYQEKPRSSPTRLTTQSPEVPRTRSPMRQSVETTTTKTVLSRYPASQGQSAKPARPETDSSKILHPEQNKPQDNVPSYQKPTITSQVKEEKTVEEMEVSSRRGSGKFGVELRRTSAERSAASSERRRSSDHHQPCIEDIFDLDLLEQMLEKVVGYEQRRRIRAQIRVAKKKETELTDTTYTKHTVTKTRSPERRLHTKSPDRAKSTPQKTFSTEHPRTSTPIKTISDQTNHKQPTKPLVNGHAKEPGNLTEKRQRSPEKPRTVVPKTKSPVRQPSPDKRTRTTSPTKTVPKAKPNRFNEYASAYIRKVGLNETDKVKLFDKTKRAEIDNQKSGQTKFSKKSEDHLTSRSQFEEHRMETKTTSTSKSMSERTSSKDTIEVTQINGKRSPSPEKKRSPEHHTQSPSERLHQRTPSPDFKRKTDVNRKETITKIVYETEPTVTKKETIIKTVYEERPRVESSKKETVIKTIYDIEKKIPGKQNQEEKPSWMTSRNLKKTSAESRVVTRRAEEKRVASRPIDAIVSSYGPGPLDADGRPLFGIKALRNGSSNYQVKGTVVRSEYHSRNGGEPEGSVSVTAYSSEPAELERLLAAQGEPPSRIHGLAAITTTKKFGAGTGTSITQAHSKEERAALDQFTHSDRRVSADLCDVTDTLRKRDDKKEIAAEKRDARRMEERRERVERREDRKTVRQSSVKSLTEKYIKSASDTCKSERSAYPKAGLILRSANMKDSVSSDSSTHAGLGRTDSEHSLASVEDTRVVSPPGPAPARGDKSFLDSSSKVSGVQDILTRMKNADIVIQEGDSTEDSEARALLNKFLGASVLMAGMQAYVTEKPTGHVAVTQQETVRSGGGRTITTTTTTTRSEDIDLDRCWDERLLRKLLEESTDYEQRRRIRARIRTLMAEQEACASAVTDALAASGAGAEADAREEEEVTVTSSVRRNSSEKTVSSSTTTKTSKVIESMTRPAPKPVSPFAKFRQLEKQNSVNSPNSPQTPQSPGSPAKAPFFKFTDPALQASALTIKERLLQWCRDKTRDYENVKLENFSTSWADGLAFCALLHHFLPDAFDYAQLSAQHRRHNFTLAFKVADEKAGIYPLLDVDDMVAMRKPDWKCVFTYVQAIHRRFKDQQ